MKVIQVGYSKSGNYWLWSILSRILKAGGAASNSYVMRQPIYSVAKEWELSFREQAEIDFIMVENNSIYWTILPFFNMRVVDEPHYYSQVSHVWTHSSCSKKMVDVFDHFDKKVCIIRDPRDVAFSYAMFNQTPFKRKYYGKIERPLKEGVTRSFQSTSGRWLKHVTPYLLHRDALGLHVIFYEHLKNDFNRELNRLAEYLDINLSEETRSQIASEVAFQAMKEKSPGHVSTGKVGAWAAVEPELERHASPELKRLLGLLKYRTGREIISLPELPENGHPFLKLLESRFSKAADHDGTLERPSQATPLGGLQKMIRRFISD